MRRFPGSTLFLAGLLAAFLLLMAALRILRWLRPSRHDIITNEIRDMVATLQGSLEAMPGIPGKIVAPLTMPGVEVGLGLLAAVGILVICARHCRRSQQRSRNNLS